MNLRHLVRIQFSFKTSLLVICFLFFTIASFCASPQLFSQEEESNDEDKDFVHPLPELKDPRLKVEIVADGLSVPTGIGFLDNDNILVLKRYVSGFQFGGLTTVNLLKDGQLREEPVVTVPTGLCDNQNVQPMCSMFNERGLLGIAIKKTDDTSNSTQNKTEVFLYYTEITLNGDILGNRVYKYDWDGKSLVNSSLILDLPAAPGPRHNSGKLLLGPDGYLYTVIGDQSPDSKLNPNGSRLHRGQLQNIQQGATPDNTSVILRVNADDGFPASGNPFKNSSSETSMNSSIVNMERYFAYGIRNSFGIDFDPLTGKLWDTENGEARYDEINLVNPGFNSGWRKIMGPMSESNITISDLVNFPGSNYSDPEFSWKYAVGVTDLEFFNSSQLGKKYQNNLFAGDYNTGSLYFFKLNKDRDGFDFGKEGSALSDLIADDNSEMSKVVLGTGFDVITDIETGPDGNLYVVSYVEHSNNLPDAASRIYRIVPED